MNEVIHTENETPLSNLPMCIVVDFCDTYTGESFFLNDPSRYGEYQSNLLHLSDTCIIQIDRKKIIVLRFC